MKRFLNHYIKFSLCILFAINAFAINSKATRVDLFNIDNGLTQSAVTCVFQDSHGFIWVGTQDGLNRYDGYQFKIYRNNPLDSSSLSNNYINSMIEDRNGNIWLGTNIGLSMLNRETGKFINYYSSQNNQNTLSDNRVFNVYEDRKGIIWVKTANSIDRYNPDNNSFLRYPHYNDLFTYSTDPNDFDIFEDREDRLWVGTKDGLYFFDRNLLMFKRYSHDSEDPTTISDDRVRTIFEDSKGNFWVGTANGLNLFDKKTKTFRRFFNVENDSNSLQSNEVNTIFEDHSGTLWVGTDIGVCSFDTKTFRFTYYNDLYNNGERLALTSVSSFCEDQSNILWIGTFQGLVKWDRKPLKFKLYSKSEDGQPLFSTNIIASILKDSNGDIWLGTWGAGLFIFNPQEKKKIQYSTFTPNHKICNDFVHAIYQTKKNEILIGTRNGIQVYQPKTKQFVDYFQYKGINSLGVFKNNRVYSFVEDQVENLWVGTRTGLFQVSNDGLVSYYNDPNDTLTITSGEVYDLIVDKAGFVWAGTLNGLNKILPRSRTSTRFVKPENYTGTELISNEILCLHEDSKGYIWVGTSCGLHKYDRTTGKFKLYTVDNGLPNNLIYSIEEDSKGLLWISTNWGIVMLNPESEIIASFDVPDGLQSHEFNIGSSCKSKAGELFFGGISGFNSFFPDSVKFNRVAPNIAITSFELFGSEKKGNVSVDGVDEVIVPKNYSIFTIEFAALDFTRPDKNQYAYKMVGLSDQWIDLGYKHSATFSNLRPGTYYFTVKGANSDQVWNEQGRTLKIVVVTYFWKTQTANFLYAVIVLLAIIIFLRVRTRNLRETSQLLKDREYAMAKIEKQKEELILKNKNITDSINYAKRIQEAIMPSVSFFKKLLPDSFILYMPKDIVSGDFYWINETKNKIFVAVIDCTGHGVPGAFMSIIGVELLRNITSIQGVNDAAEILNRLNTGIVDTFSKGFLEGSVLVKDGMDVAFCVVDKENNTLQYAGAFSNLYLIRDSKIIEIKGDRYSVGMGNEPERQLFSSHYIPIQPDDMIYIFTDGYVDQFGGPEMKKYKFRRFRHLLLNIHKFPLETQRQYLEDSIVEWKGDLDQVDDILIIGIKPDLSCLF